LLRCPFGDIVDLGRRCRRRHCYLR
jgi:hypothetical protein